MENNSKRLYLINVIGQGVTELIDDLEKLNEKLFTNKEEVVQYGNVVYFISDDTTEILSQLIQKEMGEDFGYILIDITDSLNSFDFRGNITETHFQSEKFVNIIKLFTEKKTKQEPKKTDEELLKEAILNEDYDECCKLRDKINSCVS